MPATFANNNATRYRSAGAAMAAITLLALVALSHHPTGEKTSSAQDSLLQIAAMQSSAAIVHGVLIAMFAGLAAAHAVFAGLLGATRASVRLGMTGYAIACALLTLAMLCDGFVAPQLAHRFAGSTVVHTDQAVSMLVAIGTVIQVLSKAGLLALGVALPAFAYALASNHARLPWARSLALVGLLAGLLPAAYMVFGEVQLNPSNLPLLFGVQALWYLGAAGMLFASSRTTRA
ncbi:hypothetical protein [Massilia sp. S19_KUP03_FR1]|uniref:hypothetical protein n=1 Tax=Massilia sp. S19_KUP03_FR1 TaxID=3025503 RepID=UPI002FCCF1E0